MKIDKNTCIGAAKSSPFYDIMTLLRMSGCLKGVPYEQTA